MRLIGHILDHMLDHMLNQILDQIIIGLVTTILLIPPKLFSSFKLF